MLRIPPRFHLALAATFTVATSAPCLSSCRSASDSLPPLPTHSHGSGLSIEAVPGETDGVVVSFVDGDESIHMLALRRLRSDGFDDEAVGTCLRIEDSRGHVIDAAGPISCPDGLDRHRPGAASPSIEQIIRRNALIVAASSQLAARAHSNTHELAIAALQAHLKMLARDIARVAGGAVAPGNGQVESRTDVDHSRTGAATDAAGQMAAFAPPQATQPVGARAAPASDGVSVARQLIPQSLLGPLGWWLTRHRLPAERYEDLTLEFTQEVQLFGKKALKYVVFGEPGTYDHTAPIITVLARPRDSGAPWQVFARAVARNHGTPADDPSMEAYAVCSDLPVTAGYFAWKGECPGDWGEEHLCNDDTRLQLWHAYGGWDPEPYCRNMFQSVRPTCRKPW